jgi:hypothetical protein
MRGRKNILLFCMCARAGILNGENANKTPARIEINSLFLLRYLASKYIKKAIKKKLVIVQTL